MSDPRLDELRRFARWLDAAVRVPGTPVRIGLDPLLGLVPGLGDLAGAVLGAWIVIAAAGRGASRATLLRMAANVGLDALIGALPVLGDLFDIAWKANQRNLALLERHTADPTGARTADRAFAMILVTVLLIVCVFVSIAIGARSLELVWQLLR
jgi:hypothetical protein